MGLVGLVGMGQADKGERPPDAAAAYGVKRAAAEWSGPPSGAGRRRRRVERAVPPSGAGRRQ